VQQRVGDELALRGGVALVGGDDGARLTVQT
jgi:hypothetical protein